MASQNLPVHNFQLTGERWMPHRTQPARKARGDLPAMLIESICDAVALENPATTLLFPHSARCEFDALPDNIRAQNTKVFFFNANDTALKAFVHQI